MNTYYLDTNILLAVVTGRSSAARDWYYTVLDRGDRLIASRFMEVEARHVLTNAGGDHTILDPYLEDLYLMEVDARLMHEAMTVPGTISGADAVHLATALRVIRDSPIIVTHDAQFARSARALSLTVYDPIAEAGS